MREVSGLEQVNNSTDDKSSVSRPLFISTLVIISLLALLMALKEIISGVAAGVELSILIMRALGVIVVIIIFPGVLYLFLCIFRRFRTERTLVKMYLICGIIFLFGQLISLFKVLN
jgi:hypothetical protein